MKKSAAAVICALVAMVMLLTSCNAQQVASLTDEPVTSAAPTGTAEQAAAEETQVVTGNVRGKVLTDNGSMVCFGIIAKDTAGNTNRYLTNAFGGYNIKLDPGDYTLIYTRGPEYDVVEKQVTVESYKTIYLQDVRLVQLYDAYAKGWIAGDLHQHTFYSDGMDSVDEVALSDTSAGLQFGFLSDHNSARGLAEWAQANRVTADIADDGTERRFSAFDAVEVTTEFGHYQSLGIGLTFDTYEVLLTDSERSLSGDAKDDIIREHIAYIADTITRSGGVAQINHPFSSSTMGFNYWELADHFDTVEIWNGVFPPGDGRYEPEKESEQGQNYRSKMRWFELLNEVRNGGKFLAATGGTDNHSIMSEYTAGYDLSSVTTKEDYQALYESSGRYSGVPTTYVYCDGEVTQEKILQGIRNGNSFISNGIILTGSVDGKIYGETVPISGTPLLSAEVFCRDGVEAIRIIKNGEVWQQIDCDGTTQTLTQQIPLEGMAAGDWIVIEVLGHGAMYAITNPFFFA
jgi:hypothetical protein